MTIRQLRPRTLTPNHPLTRVNHTRPTTHGVEPLVIRPTATRWSLSALWHGTRHASRAGIAGAALLWPNVALAASGSVGMSAVSLIGGTMTIAGAFGVAVAGPPAANRSESHPLHMISAPVGLVGASLMLGEAADAEQLSILGDVWFYFTAFLGLTAIQVINKFRAN